MANFISNLFLLIVFLNLFCFSKKLNTFFKILLYDPSLKYLNLLGILSIFKRKIIESYNKAFFQFFAYNKSSSSFQELSLIKKNLKCLFCFFVKLLIVATIKSIDHQNIKLSCCSSSKSFNNLQNYETKKIFTYVSATQTLKHDMRVSAAFSKVSPGLHIPFLDKTWSALSANNLKN